MGTPNGVGGGSWTTDRTGLQTLVAAGPDVCLCGLWWGGRRRVLGSVTLLKWQPLVLQQSEEWCCFKGCLNVDAPR